MESEDYEFYKGLEFLAENQVCQGYHNLLAIQVLVASINIDL